jgi:hypothetical protein
MAMTTHTMTSVGVSSGSEVLTWQVSATGDEPLTSIFHEIVGDTGC